MVRVTDLARSLDFYCKLLGLEEVHREENETGRYTLVWLVAPDDKSRAANEQSPLLQLTFYWDPETYEGARNFGHLAFEVDDIYAVCDRFVQAGITINRPPRDGRAAFVRSPDNITVELLQKGKPLVKREPWASMPNDGTW
jgi:lactoylglutathione lyase